MLNELKNRAAAQVAQYPQYAGHFDGYVLVRVKRNFRTKMGLAFTKGELTIARPCDPNSAHEFRTVWSALNEVDTGIPAKYVEEI